MPITITPSLSISGEFPGDVVYTLQGSGDCSLFVQYQNYDYFIPGNVNLLKRIPTSSDSVPSGLILPVCMCLKAAKTNGIGVNCTDFAFNVVYSKEKFPPAYTMSVDLQVVGEDCSVQLSETNPPGFPVGTYIKLTQTYFVRMVKTVSAIYKNLLLTFSNPIGPYDGYEDFDIDYTTEYYSNDGFGNWSFYSSYLTTLHFRAGATFDPCAYNLNGNVGQLRLYIQQLDDLGNASLYGEMGGINGYPGRFWVKDASTIGLVDQQSIMSLTRETPDNFGNVGSGTLYVIGYDTVGNPLYTCFPTIVENLPGYDRITSYIGTWETQSIAFLEPAY